MSAVRVFTLPVILTAPLTVGITCTMDFGASGTRDFNSGVRAFPQVTAPSYPAIVPFPVFCAKANALLRQWLIDTATDLGVTAPSLSSVELKFVFPSILSGTVDANKIDITLDPDGFKIILNDATLTAFSVDNASDWATILGTCRDSLTTKAGTIASNVGTVSGARQSSNLFVFERSDFDEGEAEVYPTLFTRVLKDGSVRTHLQDASKVTRNLRLVDLDGDMLGGPIPVATFSQLSSSNSVLEFFSTDEDGLTNVSGVYQSDDLIIAGHYYRVGTGSDIVRADVVTGTPPTSLTLFESFLEDPTQGQIVYRVSEGERLVRGAIETGYLFVHDPDDFTFSTRWQSQAYALDFQGEARIFPERRDNFLDIYSLPLPLVRRDLPEIEVF